MTCEIIYIMYNNNYNDYFTTFNLYIYKYFINIAINGGFYGKKFKQRYYYFTIYMSCSILIIRNFPWNTISYTYILILILIYLIVTKKHYIKVFKGMKSYKLEDYKTALEYYRDAAMSPWANASYNNKLLDL